MITVRATVFAFVLLAGTPFFTADVYATGACENPSEGYGGFGQNTTGGAAKTIYKVTTLSDSGTGSLRDAISQGNRCIVFDVGGTINLSGNLIVQGANITIDGFTAPSPGITLQGGTLVMQGSSDANNIIVRGIRHRGVPSGADAISVYAVSNIVIDHVSVSGFGDGAVDVTESSRDVTIQWSILGHGIETHNLASLIKYNTTRVSVHHNLYMSDDRNPFCGNESTSSGPSSEIVCDVRNNIVWDYRWYGTNIRQGGAANVVNNYYYSSYGNQNAVYIDSTSQAYTSGNVSRNNFNVNNGNRTTPYDAPTIPSSDALTAARQVLAGAGARGPNFDLDTADKGYIQTVADTIGVVITPTAPTATLSASPTTISSGQSTTLTWTSTNATSCVLSPYTSSITTSGSVTLSPTVTTTYKLACTGSGGTVSKSVTVTVSTANLVNGVCGSAHGSTFTTKPATNLCSAGTASTVSGTGPWTWQCIGSNGGTTAYCSAKLQSSILDPIPPTTSNCINALTSTTAIPTGFGASYNMFSSIKELLVSGTCSDSTATVTVGSAGTSIYVYTKGYYNSGGSWIPFTLICADGQMHSSTWCKGQGSVTVPFLGTTLNVLGYTCQLINNTWKCGCRDTSCTTRLWQMQSIQRSTTPPATAPTATLSASPTTISSGQSTTLTWTSTNATSCVLSPYTSSITTSGSVTLSPTVTTTYKLACTGSGGTVSKSVTVGVGAVTTMGRVLHTNFGPGVNLTFLYHYGYDRTSLQPYLDNYAAGDEFALTGTDQSTGYVFGADAPQLWGGRPSGRMYAGQFQKSSSIKYRVVDGGLAFKTPSQVHTLELLGNIPGPTGSPTYVLHHAYKEPYFLPDQSPYKIHLDTNLPQGMYYLRYWFKLLPGFVSQWGTGWRWYGLTENKSVADNNRAGVGLSLENGKACIRMTIDSMKGGVFKGQNWPAWQHLYPAQSGPCLTENTWYKFEFATKPANTDSGGGFAWAALNGQQFAYQAGQNIFDGETPKYWGIFLTMFYGNTANPGVGTYTTGMELWDRWPEDASAHPNVN